MLDTIVQSRYLPGRQRDTLYSPSVNAQHHRSARHYHDQALAQTCPEHRIDDQDLPSSLLAKTLLAYYHHASTNHYLFRAAIWDVTNFALQYKDRLLRTETGTQALQIWFRLCTSHRPAKPPTLLLEGEGPSIFAPNIDIAGYTDDLHLFCVMGMNADDFIYDVLIKTLELRARAVVFHCVAGVYNISSESKDLSRLAHLLLYELLGRPFSASEYAEAEAVFVKGSHLSDLFNHQEERLLLWQSRLSITRLPERFRILKQTSDDPQAEATFGKCPAEAFATHKDAMNAIYYLLCVLMLEEVRTRYGMRDHQLRVADDAALSMADIAATIFSVIRELDLSVSNVSEVYTFSLVEILRQLAFSWQSTDAFHHILDVIWPRIELSGPGYEHSHCPTHLAKRMVTYAADEYEKGREIVYAIPAVTENLAKLRLLDIDSGLTLVVCWLDARGASFVGQAVLL